MTVAPDIRHATLSELEDMARQMIKHVRLRPVEEDPELLGIAVFDLIDRAKKIARFADDPPKGAVLEAAEDVAATVERAIKQIRGFNALWPHPDNEPQRRSPWGDGGLSHLEQIAHLFGTVIPRDCGSMLPSSWEKPPKFAAPNRWKLFVGESLAQTYEELFGRRASTVNKNQKKGEYDGPFIRFARFVLDGAHVELKNATINDYLDQAQRAGRRK